MCVFVWRSFCVFTCLSACFFLSDWGTLELFLKNEHTPLCFCLSVSVCS